jgi:cell wall-associated NlpC family hydrolase
VAVSVATVWTGPDSPRPVDAAALTNPVDPGAWLAAMTLADKYELSERNLSQTQVLYGEPVYVLAEEAGWCRIAVPRQTTPRDPLGYPGWVPKVQLADDPRFAAALALLPSARVDRVTTWLYEDPLLRSPALAVSFNTRLPWREHFDGALRLDTPGHGPRWIAVGDVELSARGDAATRTTGAQLVELAKRFVGLPYVWGGRSGFALDCSGITSAVYETAGIHLPRDASAQAQDPTGRPVEIADLRTGDLLFWAADDGAGAIRHVALYDAEQQMVEAPGSADPVRVTPARFNSEYWGARRFLPPD